MSRASLFFLLTFAFPTLLHADPAADEATLKKAGVPGDGPALLKFLSGLVPRDSKLEDAALLVKRMASEDFFEREEALKKVIALGPRAAPFLRSALKESDKELVQRAEECLKIIEGGPGLDVHGATLRLIALRKPAGAAAAVLEYLPFVPNDRIGEEAAVTLAAVALEGGKVAPEFVKALGDSLAARRAAAAHVLAKVAFKEHRLELVKLLADGDPRVRFKTAVALAKHHEKEAVPVLIALLDKAPAADVASIEVMLQKLADHKGPAGPWTASAAMREAWQSWWTAHAATADLAKLTAIPKMLGHTLLVFAEEGKVEEIDKDGKLRWSFAGLQFPTVAHLVGDNKVLVAENRLRRVTLRSTTGAIERTFSVSLPTDVQMMPDGKVLAVSRLGLYEYNATGGLVRRITVPGGQAVAARVLPGGQIWCLTSAGLMLRLDNAGRELARFPTGLGVAAAAGGFDVTPEGRILLTDAGRVMEFDATGKVQREWKVAGATSATRLPNGNTLVACGARIVEIDERGGVVWEHNTRGATVVRAEKR